MGLKLDDSLTAAKELLGWKLINKTPEGITSGYIVETEAYSMLDAASHSFKGLNRRTWPMFEKPGTIYVYFTYGMHYIFNIVTGDVGNGQAVLIRALQPVDGKKLMKQRRGASIDDLQLTNGPAKLVQAMGITGDYNGTDIFNKNGKLYLEPGFKPASIEQTTRIGISRATNQKWRFYIQDNPYVSKR